MLKWEKTGYTVRANGSKKTVYTACKNGRQYVIESRKEPIPRAKGGVWFFTQYFLMANGAEQKFSRLCDAKDAAETLEQKEEV